MVRRDLLRKEWDLRSSNNTYGFLGGALPETDIARQFTLGLSEEKLREMTLLDIGSGYGRMERVLSDKCLSVVGIDVSLVNLSRSSRFNRGSVNTNFILTDGSTLSCMRDVSVDLVISFAVFQHLPASTFKSYLRESFRVLRHGGLFRFQFEDRWARAAEIPKELLSGRLRRSAGGLVNLLIFSDDGVVLLPWSSSAPMGKLFSFRSIARILEAIGFKGVTRHNDGFSWVSSWKE